VELSALSLPIKELALTSLPEGLGYSPVPSGPSTVPEGPAFGYANGSGDVDYVQVFGWFTDATVARGYAAFADYRKLRRRLLPLVRHKTLSFGSGTTQARSSLIGAESKRERAVLLLATRPSKCWLRGRDLKLSKCDF